MLDIWEKIEYNISKDAVKERVAHSKIQREPGKVKAGGGGMCEDGSGAWQLKGE